MAEEQPVAPGGAGGLAFEQESAEWRDAGAGADHDDRYLRILRKTKTVRLLHIDFHLIAGLDSLGEEGRGKPQPPALANDVTHAVDGQRQVAGRRGVRGGDRIKPRL